MKPTNEKLRENSGRGWTLALGLMATATLAVAQNPQGSGPSSEVTRITEIPPVPLVRPAAAPQPATRAIDIAICLDTSGSMRGLINAARQKIWTIVNDLALAKPEPRLRVALLAYGGGSYSPEDGWVRVATPLTGDLDLVSQELFALNAAGSTELVGRVVDTSTRTLQWSSEPGALKLIIVAGNESADQDRAFPFREACTRAIGRDIMINAIYCGPDSDGVAPGWRELARLADGKFASIDMNGGTVTIETPFDADLSTLSTEVNGTYLYYGEGGRGAWQNQSVQDNNAVTLNSEAQASRAKLKAGKFYKNSHWDLVDAAQEKDFVLADVKEEHLPESMRKMTLEERAKHVQAMGKKRAEIQRRITEVSAKRDAYLQQELARVDQTKSFDFVIRQTVRDQAASRGFEFEPAPEPAPDSQPAPAPQPEPAPQPDPGQAPAPKPAPAPKGGQS